MREPAATPRPAVSVVLAVYNAGGYLRPAVASVLAQTFADFELIAIDDGSTDGSGAVLAKFAAADPRVRLVTQPNAGLIASLNRGVALARAPLIARMDGDDLCRPDRLAKQVAFMARHPEVVLLGGGYELIDGKGRALRLIDPPDGDDELQRFCLAGRTSICHPLAMMRRAAVLRVGGYHDDYETAEDLDLFLRLGEVGELACIPDVLLSYRMHDASVSGTRQREQVEAARRACADAAARRGVAMEFHGSGGWRPGPGSAARFRQMAKFGWWAYRSGHRRTALVYAAKAMRLRPLSPEAWKLLACAAAVPNRNPLTPTPLGRPPEATPLRPGVARRPAAAPNPDPVNVRHAA